MQVISQADRITALFTVIFCSFALQCNPTWMRGSFGLKLQNSLNLPHIHDRFHINANFFNQFLFKYTHYVEN